LALDSSLPGATFLDPIMIGRGIQGCEGVRGGAGRGGS
jgi:hypothetical protein